MLAEPLLHFLLIGTAVFFIAGQSGSSGATAVSSDKVIEVSDDEVARLSSQFAATWNRPPSDEEIAGLVESFVREEVLYREAIALGLDDGDAVIRQRMRLKMEFIGESVAATLEPDETELAAWYADHADQFRPPARLDFLQVMLGDGDDPSDVLAALSEGAAPDSLGRSSLLPASVADATQAAVDGTFGPGFFAAVAGLPSDTWSGPIQSSFGTHVVSLTGVDRPELPPLDDNREQVIAAWRQAQAEALREAQYQALRARYDIRLPAETE